MTKKIAVLLNNAGQTETMYASTIIEVYSKEKSYWEVVNQFPFTLKNLTTVKLIRESLVNLIGKLDECKIIVAKELSGIPHTVLDMSGFTILEVEGKPEDFLDEILESLEKYQISLLYSDKDKECNISPVPINNEGGFYINLKEIQNNNQGVSSKQALRPFLNNTTFYELTVVCSHIPNWLDGELKKLNMALNTTMVTQNEYKITIFNKTCNED